MIRDVVLTDAGLSDAGQALADWLGAQYIRRISIPQEPDAALLADEIEVATVILTSVIHGGGSTAPILRGLLAGGRSAIAVCCLVDARLDPSRGMQVAGHDIPIVAALVSSAEVAKADASRLETEASAQLDAWLDGTHGDSSFYDAVATSPGALSLGHFHSENRAWMSALVTPSAIADPTTEIGRLIIERLATAVRAEVEVMCPGARVNVRDLSDATLLTQHLRAALNDFTEVADGGVVVLVDWGALTGETAVRGAWRAAQLGPTAVIVAIGVDRSHYGAHHLLNRSTVPVRVTQPGRLFVDEDDLEERQVRVSFLSAVAFPRDHRSEVDCPLCATERSLLRLRSMPTALVDSRLRTLRVRTAHDLPYAESIDAFACPMPSGDVRRFLIWRDILHRGMDDCALAHGVGVRLKRSPGLPAQDLVALARNLVLNPDLLRRRPWSSPQFRHALAEAVGHFLLSNESLSISSNMASQLVTVLRMASKTEFARRAGRIYCHWESADVRGELEIALATALRDNISTVLLDAIDASLSAFEGARANEPSRSLGVLKGDITRLRAKRLGASGMRARWRDARASLASLQSHMGLGAALARLPLLIDGLFQPRPVSRRITLLDSAMRRVHEIEGFAASSYERVRALVEDEIDPLVERGAANPFPDGDAWISDCRRLAQKLASWRSDAEDGPGFELDDLQRLVNGVLRPLDISTGAKTFSALVLSTPSDLARAVDAVAAEVDTTDCVVSGLSENASVLFPELALRDLVSHLIENASKHRSHAGKPPEVRFELLQTETHLEYLRVHIAYLGTKTDEPINPTGGLSEQQWGGAIAAFGGAIDIVAPAADESYALNIEFPQP